MGVCEADSRGHLHLVAAHRAEDLGPIAVDDVKAALRRLGEVREADRTPHLWVAGHLTPRSWCAARVRSVLPQPPPAGVERRSPERLTLKLGGVCIGLIEAPDREARASEDAAPQALLASVAEQIPAIVWTTDDVCDAGGPEERPCLTSMFTVSSRKPAATRYRTALPPSTARRGRLAKFVLSLFEEPR